MASPVAARTARSAHPAASARQARARWPARAARPADRAPPPAAPEMQVGKALGHEPCGLRRGRHLLRGREPECRAQACRLAGLRAGLHRGICGHGRTPYWNTAGRGELEHRSRQARPSRSACRDSGKPSHPAGAVLPGAEGRVRGRRSSVPGRLWSLRGRARQASVNPWEAWRAHVSENEQRRVTGDKRTIPIRTQVVMIAISLLNFIDYSNTCTKNIDLRGATIVVSVRERTYDP